MSQEHLSVKEVVSLDYIFLAEFDIDEGCKMKLTYPEIQEEPFREEIPTIAALMLPDGSHQLPQEDYIFMLRYPNIERQYYVLTMYKHMQKMGINRNTRVKALAFVSTSKHICSLRPLLNAGLSKIFVDEFGSWEDHPEVKKDEHSSEKRSIIDEMMKNTITQLYDQINYQLEETHFQEEKQYMEQIFQEKYLSTLLAFSLQQYPKSTFKIKLSMGSDTSQISQIVNAGTPTELSTINDSAEKKKLKPNEVNIKSEGEIKIPHYLIDNMIDDHGISLLWIVNILKSNIMPLFNALMTSQNILVGHSVESMSKQLSRGSKAPSAGTIARIVLSIGLLISSIPEELGVKLRFYPYTSILDQSFMTNTEGYVAGTTNPMLAAQTTQYDVLFDIVSQSLTFTNDNVDELLQMNDQDEAFYNAYVKPYENAYDGSKIDTHFEWNLRQAFYLYGKHLLQMTLFHDEKLLSPPLTQYLQNLEKDRQQEKNSDSGFFSRFSNLLSGSASTPYHCQLGQLVEEEALKILMCHQSRTFLEYKKHHYNHSIFSTRMNYDLMRFNASRTFQSVSYRLKPSSKIETDPKFSHLSSLTWSDETIYSNLTRTLSCLICDELAENSFYVEKLAIHIDTRKTNALLAHFIPLSGGLASILQFLLHPSQLIQVAAIRILITLESMPVGRHLIYTAVNPLHMMLFEKKKKLLHDFL